MEKNLRLLYVMIYLPSITTSIQISMTPLEHFPFPLPLQSKASYHGASPPFAHNGSLEDLDIPYVSYLIGNIQSIDLFIEH